MIIFEKKYKNLESRLNFLMSEKDFSAWWLTNIINNTIIKS
jgi:hypothetical protein